MSSPLTANTDGQNGTPLERTPLTAKRSEGQVEPTIDRVLLVDDKSEMRELLTQLFQHWSYATVSAATVAEARHAVLTQGPFKVVVCDFELPDGNGLQFWSWLRWERRDETRFLLMSGSTSFVRHRAADFAFLAKPFRPEELHRTVLELIGPKPETPGPAGGRARAIQ